MNNSINVGGSIVRDDLKLLLEPASIRSYEGEPTENLIPPLLVNNFTTTWSHRQVTLENKGEYWKMQTTGIDDGNNRSFIRLSSSNISYTQPDSTPNQLRAISIFVKPISHFRFVLSCQTNTNFDWPTGAMFDLSTQTVYPFTNYGVTPQGNIHKLKDGWFRISISLVTSDNYNERGNGFTFGFANNNQTNASSRNFTGTGDEVVFIKNAQAEEKSYPTPFTPTSRSPIHILKDLSGNNHNFDFAGDGPFPSTQSGNMVNFGYNNFAALSNAAAPNLNFNKNSSFTISVWFRVNELHETGSNSGVINKGATSNSFGISVVNENLIAGVRDSSGSFLGPVISATSSVPFNLGDVYNVVMCYSPSVMKVYINGELIYTSSTAPIDLIDTDISNTSPWTLSRYGISGTSRESNADIGQIAIYNRMLSDNEVKHNYLSTKSRYGH